MPKRARGTSSGAASSSETAQPPVAAVEITEGLTSAQHTDLLQDLYRRLHAVDPSSAAEAVAKVRASTDTQVEKNHSLAGAWLLISNETKKPVGHVEFAIDKTPPPGRKTGGSIALKSFCCNDDQGDELMAENFVFYGCPDNEDVLEFETEHRVCNSEFKGTLRVYSSGRDGFHGDFEADDYDGGDDDYYSCSAEFTLQRTEPHTATRTHRR